MRDQVLSAQSQIASVTGVDPWPWFRFPYGDYSQHAISVVNGAGFVPVGWTVDTLGWKGTSGGITAQTVVDRVLGSLRPGEIVLMHCGSNPDDHSTLDADTPARGDPGVHNYGRALVRLGRLPAARWRDRGRDSRRPGHWRLPGPQVRWWRGWLRRPVVRIAGQAHPGWAVRDRSGGRMINMPNGAG